MPGLRMPFSVGDQLWMPVGEPYEVIVPCPVCNGSRVFDVILGSGERLTLPCEGCRLGYEGPRGSVRTWDHTPRAVAFIVDDVESYHNDRWRLKSTTGAMHDFDDLYLTEAEALAVATARAAQQHESCMASYQHKKKSLKHAGWTVRYHRDKIADLERQIAWHRGRIDAKAHPEVL